LLALLLRRNELNVDRIVLWALGASFLCGCAAPKPPALVVGSKDGTDHVVLGEVIARHIEGRLGQSVQRRFNIGKTRMAHDALSAGEIDLYAEDISSARIVIFKFEPIADADITMERVRQGYQQQQLEWVVPLGFSSTFALAVTEEFAKEHGLETLSDAAKLKDGWKFGASPEFLDRADGLAAMQRAYHLEWSAPPKSMESKAAYGALEKYEVTLVAGALTDGALASGKFRVLTDDKEAFGPAAEGIAVRAATLLQTPGLRLALQELNGKLTIETVRKLSAAVDAGVPVQQVVLEWMTGAGLGTGAPRRLQ
jgi:glycine betaine/choline ABC-type transport system substrate-binding protein